MPLRSYRLPASASILRIAPLSSDTSSLSPLIPFLLMVAVIISSVIPAVFLISSSIVIFTDFAILYPAGAVISVRVYSPFGRFLRIVGSLPDTNVITLPSIVMSSNASPPRSAVTPLRSVSSGAVSWRVAPGSSLLPVSSNLLIESSGFCSSTFSASHTVIVFFDVASS